MIDTAGAFGALLYGTILLWAAVNITGHLSRLVREPRPAPLVCMRMTAVWSIGVASILASLFMIAQGILVIDRISQ